jgi:hypothetical protein
VPDFPKFRARTRNIMSFGVAVDGVWIGNRIY